MSYKNLSFYSHFLLSNFQFLYFRNSHFDRGQDEDDMIEKGMSSSGCDETIREHSAMDHIPYVHPCIASKPVEGHISEFSMQHQGHHHDVDLRTSQSSITEDGIRNVFQPPPLQRKVSNINSDSGRSSTSDNEEHESLNKDLIESDSHRRHSIAFADNSGHLNVPNVIDDISMGNAALHNCSSCNSLVNNQQGSRPVMSYTKSRQCLRQNCLARNMHTKMYRSFDTAGSYRQFGYSPVGSPTSSPRLRHQPALETRRVSVTDSDGFIQLNQYKLKDEIGKVCCLLVLFEYVRF